MGVSLAYLVIQMPVPSEVFLSTEVRCLVAAGAKIQVFGLRRRHHNYAKLVQDHGLADLPITHFPYVFSREIWRDVRYWGRRNPGIFWQIAWTVTRRCWRRPILWAKSLGIIPKSFSIARQIEAAQIPIVHVAWGHYPAVTAYLLKQVLPDIQITLALGAYDRLMHHPMTPLAANEARYILTQSDTSAELIRQEWPKLQTPVIPILRGVDLAEVDRMAKVEKIPGLIVSAGRLVQEKGYHLLIDAFAKVHMEYPDTRLAILGDGHYRHALERQVDRLHLSQAIELTGHLKHSDLFRRLAQAELFVLASEADYDNLPNVLKEAMALGIPVITTPTVGIETLVQDGISGLLVEKADVDAIANKIRLLLEDRALAQTLSENGRQRVRTFFDVRQTTEQRLKLFESLKNE